MKCVSTSVKFSHAIIAILLSAAAIIFSGCPAPAQVVTPTFNPTPGIFKVDQSVTFNCATPGATIYYTTDGTDPTYYSTMFSSAIPVVGDGTTVNIKAIAAVLEMRDSELAESSYSIHYPGALDEEFLASGNGIDAGTVMTIAMQGDGKILIGGTFTSFNGTPRGYIARLNVDGSLDTSFLATGAGANNYVLSIAVLSTGRIIIGGSFSAYNEIDVGYIARLNSDGSLDTTFLSTGGGASGSVWSIALADENKLLIGGGFSTYNSVSRGRIARLNGDGSLDADFLSSGTGASGIVYCIAVQKSDEKIIIGGEFSSYNGMNRGRLARLNDDGSLDAAFPIAGDGADDAVHVVAEQSDGKILIGGKFHNFSFDVSRHFTRLLSSGVIDPTFISVGANGGTENEVYAIALPGDGTIIIGGAFGSFNGINRGRIAKMSSDGSMDSSFLSSGTGVNGSLRSVALLNDGKILIGGNFTDYNGIARGSMARLWN